MASNSQKYGMRFPWSNLSSNIVTSRTPLRVSFVGGGTDVSAYYNRFGGEVVSAAINRFIYVQLKRHGELFDEAIRINYSNIELKQNVGDVENLIVRGCLERLDFDGKIFIGTVSDLPAQSGLGSSSSFGVGLLNALHKSVGKSIGPGSLARLANEIEIEILKRPMGKQDAYPAAFGGLSRLSFNKNGSVSVTPINISEENLETLDKSLFLVYTGVTRESQTVLEEQLESTRSGGNMLDLHAIKGQVPQLVEILENSFCLSSVGQLLSDGWKRKRLIGKRVSDNHLDEIYEKIMSTGCLGAKLCGAGGGGFFLCVVDQRDQKCFLESLSEYSVLQIATCSFGSQII